MRRVGVEKRMKVGDRESECVLNGRVRGEAKSEGEEQTVSVQWGVSESRYCTGV